MSLPVQGRRQLGGQMTAFFGAASAGGVTGAATHASADRSSDQNTVSAADGSPANCRRTPGSTPAERPPSSRRILPEQNADPTATIGVLVESGPACGRARSQRRAEGFD